MAMGRRKREVQDELWIVAHELPESPGHPFYERLNQVLEAEGFDKYVEELCSSVYAEIRGRPSIPPGVYFRMLMIGYFERITSERGIAWRCADSRALQSFLGYSLTERTPDHSSLCVIRKRLPLEVHDAVFKWVLTVLSKRNLLKGKTLGVDATTLEANAALRSIVRRDTGESYQEFLTQLAKNSGIENPTREDLARIDRKRAKKGSNEDWKHPHDPDARIAKMKDGSTHIAHKLEQAVDLDSGAVVGVNLTHADKGDTETLLPTLAIAAENLKEVAQASPGTDEAQIVQEVVADKGYHSNDTMRDLAELDICSYVAEPTRGNRHWDGLDSERDAVYANRRRIRGERGKSLLRRRGELLERPFALNYSRQSMRRIWLREHTNILKRVLIHVCGCNLGLLLRTSLGVGTPRMLAEQANAAALALLLLTISIPRRLLNYLAAMWLPRAFNVIDRVLPTSCCEASWRIRARA